MATGDAALLLASRAGATGGPRVEDAVLVSAELTAKAPFTQIAVLRRLRRLDGDAVCGALHH
jgi:hypothetical protein